MKIENERSHCLAIEEFHRLEDSSSPESALERKNELLRAIVDYERQFLAPAYNRPALSLALRRLRALKSIGERHFQAV